MTQGLDLFATPEALSPHEKQVNLDTHPPGPHRTVCTADPPG